MPQRKKLRYYNKHLSGGTNDLCPICLEELNEDDDTLNCDSSGCRFRCHSYCLEELCRAREPYRRVCPYCKNPNICDQLDNTSIINIVENLDNENRRRFRNEIDVLLRHDVVRVELGYRAPGVIYSILSPNDMATGIDEMLFHNDVDDTPEEQLLAWLNTHFDKYKTTAFSIDGRDTERLSLEIRERYENLEQIKQETIDLEILWFFVDISTEKYISHLQNLYDHLFTVFREYKPILERNLSYRLPPTNTIMEQYNTLKKVAKDIYYFRTILIKRENSVNLTNASNIRTHYRNGDISTAKEFAGRALRAHRQDRVFENSLQNIQLNAEELEIEPEPDPQEIIGGSDDNMYDFSVGSDMQDGGAGAKRIHTHTPNFLIKLHKMLSQPEHYSNIISWTKNEKGKIVIIIKDKIEVLKEICPASSGTAFGSCTRQFTNYSFFQPRHAFGRPVGAPIHQKSHTYYHHSELENIDDILNMKGRERTRSGMYVDSKKKQKTKEIGIQGDDEANEAANVLASIANISDENTEDLDRRISYLQNLNTNNEHSLKIALLIESLKNHVIDENEKNQINQKQNKLWQTLKEVDLNEKKRKDILYQYMFEYIKRTIPISKLKEGTKIAKSNFESIKRAQIHNRPTKPLTESEQKQADEEMNAAISRGSQLAQDEDTNMEDVQSPNTQFVEEPWWKKGGITDKTLLRLHSEPVDGHMIEVWSLDHWKLGRAVRKKGRSQVVFKAHLNSPSSRVAETVRQIVTQVDYIDGTSVDELLHRGDWKQKQNPVMKASEDYLFNLGSDNPKYWRYAKSRRSAKSNSGSQSGGVIYVDDENDKMRFECPLSLDIMKDPVIAEDGNSYEKEEIENWIKLSEDKGNPITSPITGDNMGKTLIPNTVLKDIIENSIFDRQRHVESLSQIEDENKNKGIVIQYKNSKYGFIHTFDGIDNLFFHSSQLDNQIIVGDIVSFVIKEFKGKPTATNIKLIEPAWNRKTGVIVKYRNDKQYGFIEPNINGMRELFFHISEINQLVSVGDKVSFIIGPNMAGKAVAKKIKIINDEIDDEIGVEEEKEEDSEIPQLEQRLLMDLIFERDRIMRERQKVNSMIKSRK